MSLATLGAALAFAPGASAETFCVGAHFGCDGDEFDSLQEALTAAHTGGDPHDRVRIGPGTFDVAQALDVIGNEVTIVGSGTDRTELVGNGGSYGLQISEADSKVQNLRIHIEQTASTYRGLKLQGDAKNILVNGVSDTDAAGVQMEGGGTVKLSKSKIRLPINTDAVGVYGGGGADRLITGTNITAAVGVRVNATGSISEIERSRITATIGVVQDSGGVEVDDSLVRVKPAQTGHAEAGFIAYGFDGSSGMAINHTTQVGARPMSSADAGTIGVLTPVTGDARTALLRNCILFRNEVDVRNFGGFVSLDYTRWETIDESPVSDSHGTDANPRFADGYKLRRSSPMIDRGQPFGLLPGEPPLDLAGNDRITDGDGHHGARRDLGAYERQP